MRLMTIDWMFSLSLEMDILRNTMHLAIIYFDSYLTKASVSKAELQLVAIACFVLAYKFEQKAPARFIDMFVSQDPRGFSRARIL